MRGRVDYESKAGDSMPREKRKFLSVRASSAGSPARSRFCPALSSFSGAPAKPLPGPGRSKAPSATFSLLTDGKHLVSFDDVVEVMYRTGHDLQMAYRETAQGGLASLWRKRINKETPASGKPDASAKGSGC